ncbi:MAG: hypothetical protein OXC14_12120 [Rhodospirillaceae bacterium]|nr:hypothetical protein [Rhodospirillaceae bacterium]
MCDAVVNLAKPASMQVLLARERLQSGGTYNPVGHDPGTIDRLFVNHFLDAHGQAPTPLVSTSTPPTTCCTAAKRGASSTVRVNTAIDGLPITALEGNCSPIPARPGGMSRGGQLVK